MECEETVKESDIVCNKLVRHLRNLNLTYSFKGGEQLYNRLKKVVDD